MNVSTKSWHGRVYRWWTERASWQWRLTNPDRRRETLCHYVRVVLIYAPFVWFWTAMPFKRFPAIRPWMPVVLVAALTGLTVSIALAPRATLSVFLTVAAGLAAVAGASGALFGLAWLKGTLEDRHMNRQRRVKEDTGPSFLRVSWEYAKSAKRRVCPFIEVEGPGVSERWGG